MPPGQHGGYRRPSKPAAVSGPGAHSRRTDGQPIRDLDNADYGENATFREAQAAAPLAKLQPPGAASAPAAPPQMPTGLSEPSQQPTTPVTAGAAYGAGPGPEALGLVNGDKQDGQDFQRYLPVLIDIAQRESTPASTKAAIRRLLAYSRGASGCTAVRPSSGLA